MPHVVTGRALPPFLSAISSAIQDFERAGGKPVRLIVNPVKLQDALDHFTGAHPQSIDDVHHIFGIPVVYLHECPTFSINSFCDPGNHDWRDNICRECGTQRKSSCISLEELNA